MNRVMANKGGDPALVVCKALGFGWQTARAIVLLQTRGHGMSPHSLEMKNRNFQKLSNSGAQDVLRLWNTMHDVDQPAGMARIGQGRLPQHALGGAAAQGIEQAVMTGRRHANQICSHFRGGFAGCPRRRCRHAPRPALAAARDATADIDGNDRGIRADM